MNRNSKHISHGEYIYGHLNTEVFRSIPLTFVLLFDDTNYVFRNVESIYNSLGLYHLQTMKTLF